MEELVKTALAGTARRPAPPPVSDDAVGQLMLQIKGTSPEQMLLLRAGGEAIYRIAGTLAQPVPPLPAAPPEPGINPGPRLETLMEQGLGEDAADLLPEFVEVLKHFGIHFPHRLLPIALNLTSPARRELLRPILGARARWLAGLNPDWSQWLAEDDPATRDEQRLRFIWEEGTFAERAAAFKQMRALSPALARSWLDASITSEKADQRRQLLELMEPQLSLDDEPFLSGLLSDRSEKVRELAIQFLTRSPGSALSRRMCDRGAGILQRLGAGSEFSLACVPPETLPEDWESDGIRTASEEAGGRRAHWVRQIMAAIPLDFWTSHFHESPAAILEAIHKEQFADVILDGWRMATIRFAERDPGAQSWLRLLWDQAIRQLAEPGHPAEKTIAFLHAAATKLAPAELDVGLQLLIRSISEPMRLDAGPLFEALPAPWSVALSRSYLKFSRALFQSRIDHAADRWLATLLPAARGLAPESIPAALEPWIMSPDFRSSGRIEKVLQRFGEVIRLRRAFREEAERVACGHKPE